MVDMDPFQDPESVDASETEAILAPGDNRPESTYLRQRDDSTVEWLSLESVLTPAALAKLRQLGPDFQRAVEAHVRYKYVYRPAYDFQTFALFTIIFEIGLLRVPAEMELPTLEDYLSEKQLAQLSSISQDIRDTVEPGFHHDVVHSTLGLALYPSSTIPFPPEDFLKPYAESQLALAELKDRTRPDGS